jgi:zinc protease
MKFYKLCCFIVAGCLLMSCGQPTDTSSAGSVVDIKTWQTDQGATVMYVHAPEIPMVDILLGFDAGSARDGEQYGLAWLTGNLLTQGTENLTADQIAERFEDIGAQFNASVGRDMATLQLRSLAKSRVLEQAMANLTEILTNVNFPPEALEREKARQSSLISYNEQSPEQQAERAFFQTLYPQHPYGHSIIGDQATVTAITRPVVQNFYNQFYTASNLTIAIVGDINRRQAKRLANQLADAIPLGQAAAELPTPRPPQSTVEKIDFPAGQTIIKYGMLGMNYQSPDYYSLLVGNHIFGGAALVSRLFQVIREDRGLAYSVYSQLSPMQVTGPFLISLGTQNAQASEALATIKQSLADFVEQGPSDAELVAAKQNITGSFPLRLDSNVAIARAILAMGFYRLPMTYLSDYQAHIDQVTVQDIQHAFARHFSIDDMITVLVGNHVET